LQNLVANAGNLQRVLQAGREAQQAAEAAQANEAQRAADKKSEQVDEPEATKDKVIEEAPEKARERDARRRRREVGGDEEEKKAPGKDEGPRQHPRGLDTEGRIIDVEV